MTFRFLLPAMLLGSVLIVGCGPAKHVRVPQLETAPVTGTVLVDGEPAAGLTVEFFPQQGTDTIKHSVIATTDDKGNFSVGMYQAGDGLPEGTYNVVFLWEFGIVPKDKLNRAYADPAKSKHQVTVVKGEPTDLGVIELSMKKPG